MCGSDACKALQDVLGTHHARYCCAAVMHIADLPAADVTVALAAKLGWDEPPGPAVIAAQLAALGRLHRKVRRMLRLRGHATAPWPSPAVAKFTGSPSPAGF